MSPASSDTEAAIEAIESFVLLAREARRRALPSNERARLTSLDEALRDLIDGARPAPKRIEGPSSSVGGSGPSTAVAPARLEVRPSTGPASGPVVVSGHSAPLSAPNDVQASTETNAKPVLAPQEGPSGGLETDETGPVRLRRADAKKLSRVGLSRIPESAYTRSERPSFLSAYYEDAVDAVPSPPRQPPRQVVDVDGEPVELPAMTLDLWALSGSLPAAQSAPPKQDGSPNEAEDERPRVVEAEKPPASLAPTALGGTKDGGSASEPPASLAPTALGGTKDGGSASEPPASLAPTALGGTKDGGSASEPPASLAPTALGGTKDGGSASEPDPTWPPAIVHLLEGGTRRGHLARFDAEGGSLEFLERGKRERASILLEDVLVIFFGRRPESPPTIRSGTRVEVTLVNDRRLSGFSPDYQPNGSALSVIPEHERGGVDRVWVPAWSVKAIVVD